MPTALSRVLTALARIGRGVEMDGAFILRDALKRASNGGTSTDNSGGLGGGKKPRKGVVTTSTTAAASSASTTSSSPSTSRLRISGEGVFDLGGLITGLVATMGEEAKQLRELWLRQSTLLSSLDELSSAVTRMELLEEDGGKGAPVSSAKVIRGGAGGAGGPAGTVHLNQLRKWELPTRMNELRAQQSSAEGDLRKFRAWLAYLMNLQATEQPGGGGGTTSSTTSLQSGGLVSSAASAAAPVPIALESSSAPANATATCPVCMDALG